MPQATHHPSPAQARSALAIHAGVFLAVNALLVLINLGSDGDYWFQWPLLGWGAGLALHAWIVSSRVGILPGGPHRREPVASTRGDHTDVGGET